MFIVSYSILVAAPFIFKNLLGELLIGPEISLIVVSGKLFTISKRLLLISYCNKLLSNTPAISTLSIFSIFNGELINIPAESLYFITWSCNGVSIFISDNVVNTLSLNSIFDPVLSVNIILFGNKLLGVSVKDIKVSTLFCPPPPPPPELVESKYSQPPFI